MLPFLSLTFVTTLRASFAGLLVMRTVGYELEALNFEETGAGEFASDTLSLVAIVSLQRAFLYSGRA